MTTERDTTIMEEHHKFAGGRIAEAARDASLSPVPAEPGTPAEALDLDAIEARANAATEAPWHGEHELYDGRFLPCVSIGNYGWVCSGERSPEYDVDSEQGKADAEFIAHARSDVPVLVAAVRRLRAELDAARSTVPGPAPTERKVPYEDPQHVRDDIAQYVRDGDAEKAADMALNLLADLEAMRNGG